MFKRTVHVAAAALVAAGTVSIAGPASAQDLTHHCRGTRISAWHTIKNQISEPIGKVALFYSSANGGTNCVETRNFLPGRQYTKARLTVKNRPGRDSDTDSGNFKWFAATQLNRANGRCATFSGSVHGGRHKFDYGSYTYSGKKFCD